jgi:hypothetical protein
LAVGFRAGVERQSVDGANLDADPEQVVALSPSGRRKAPLAAKLEAYSGGQMIEVFEVKAIVADNAAHVIDALPDSIDS